MDRSSWLKQQQHDTEDGYDKIWAPLYGEKWGVYGNATHQQFIQKFLGFLPPSSTILDAACGAGRYMSTLLEKGHAVIGVDQSQGMLDRAQAKYAGVRLEKMALQEMTYQDRFDGAICMDALEHICPEDWLLILQNFHDALKAQGYLYFSVELATKHEIEAAFQQGIDAGLPVVYGEWINDGVYHYYPAMSRVREWLQQSRFDLVEEGEGDGYQHFIAHKAF